MKRNILNRTAAAEIKGIEKYSSIRGRVLFRKLQGGFLVTAQVYGLPGKDRVFGFHIHEGESCTGNSKDPLANALTHYNPDNKEHPYHAGDMPPLFGNNGYAYLSFYTDRFNLNEIIGKVVIIHDGTDDFRTQPGGDSGNKIACGKIILIN